LQNFPFAKYYELLLSASLPRTIQLRKKFAGGVLAECRQQNIFRMSIIRKKGKTSQQANIKKTTNQLYKKNEVSESILGIYYSIIIP
jgi:hypothetical protein